MAHKPVLLQEVINGLSPKAGETVLDATLGGAGHALALSLKIGEAGLLIGMDEDEDALSNAREKLSGAPANFKLVKTNFKHFGQVLKDLHVETIDKALFDLGMSSLQLDDPKKGFSFSHDGPLRMTFDSSLKENLTAWDVVNKWKEDSLSDILFGFGEERYARRIAAKIVNKRVIEPIETTLELAQLIEEAVPYAYTKRKIHPATKSFQAIRMAVNDEVGALEKGLEAVWDALSKNGRLAVISFHSIEDRIVKHFFKNKKESEHALVITKRPLRASKDEIRDNPRSRSAKLRVIQK